MIVKYPMGIYLEETNDNHIVLISESLGRVNGLESLGGGTGLLLQPGHDGVGGSAAGVLNSLAVPECIIRVL